MAHPSTSGLDRLRAMRGGSASAGPRKAARIAKAPVRDQWCPGPECSHATLLARQMRDSLLGNPHTVFVKDRHGNVPGGYSYLRVKSQNADWFQEYDGDQKSLRRAIDLLAEGKPLKLTRKADAWLAHEVEHARTHGWYATFGGKASPIGLEAWVPAQSIPSDTVAGEGSPSLGMFRKRHNADVRMIFRPKKPTRIYLALPESDARRVLRRASALHESPNLFLNHVIIDNLERTEAAEADPDDLPF